MEIELSHILGGLLFLIFFSYIGYLVLELFIMILFPQFYSRTNLKIWKFRKKLLAEKIYDIEGKVYSIKVIQHRKSIFSRRMIQVLVGTPGAMPEILLDSNNLVASLYFERHEDVKRFQYQSFEGDMDSHFKVFTPTGLKLEATQFLSPDVLIFFRDNFSDYDVLISDGTIDLRKSGTVEVNQVVEKTEYLVKKIARYYKYSKVQTMIDSVSDTNKLVK